MARDIRNQFGRMMDSAKSGIATGLTNVQTAIHQQTGGASYFYPNTLDLQESKMSGWLRKQSTGLTARTSWQRRWFTLKGDYMYYYASQDESKPPMGVIFLPGATVVEHVFNHTDVEKFRFEITTAQGDGCHSGGGGGSGVEGHLMSADCEEDRRDWIKVINVVLYASVGGAIFGQPLEITLRFEMMKDRNRKVPEIVQACVEYLRKYGLKEEGIFRLPGRAALIKQLCCAYDRGERPVIDSDDMDIHTASSLLKLYLRELPDPLIPASYYETVMRIVTREIPVGEAEPFEEFLRVKEVINGLQLDIFIATQRHNPERFALSNLGEMLRQIPFASYNTLQYICRFLNEVAQYSDVNKMTFINLATIFVQAFICPEIDDPSSLLGTVAMRTQACLVLITHTDRIFKMEYTAYGVALVIDDILGLNDNNTGVNVDTTTSRERTSYFSRPFNSDLAGLDLSDWGGLDSLDEDSRISGEHLKNSDDGVDDKSKNDSLGTTGPRLRNKHIDLNADISLDKSRERPSHIDGQSSLNDISRESQLRQSSLMTTDNGGGDTQSHILRANNNIVIPPRRHPPVILRPKPGVASDSNREAFLLAKATLGGTNGRTVDADRGKTWEIGKTFETKEEVVSAPTQTSNTDVKVNGTTVGGTTVGASAGGAGVELRPRTVPRVAKHTRNSSLQFQNSSSTVKPDLVRSNSSVISSLVTTSSARIPSSHPVVPPRPKLAGGGGGGGDVQNRPNRLQHAATLDNRRSCIEFQGPDSRRAGLFGEFKKVAELHDHKICNEVGQSNNIGEVLMSKDIHVGNMVTSINTIDVSKMSWEQLVTHVTRVCSELESKQSVIDGVRHVLQATPPGCGGGAGPVDVRDVLKASPPRCGSSGMAGGERERDEADTELLERISDVVTLLQKYRDKYGEIN